MKKHLFLFSVLLLVFSYSCKNKAEKGNKQTIDIIEIIEKVNSNWQKNNSKHENSFWHRAAYHTGNMAVYHITKNNDYLDFSRAWAEHNKWMGAQSLDKSNWKYSYGETDEYVLFGDFQTCFQVYIDFYNLEKDEMQIARAKEVMEYQISTPNTDYLWWADGLYMVMPVLTKMYKLTGEDIYLEKLYEYFKYARDLMYDAESKLFYRDAKYIYPKHQTDNGVKDFWARGNGWVFAGLAKVLNDLPQENTHRTEYLQIYKDMAQSLAKSQHKEGYWTRSILDPQHAPGRETSGTAFFAYGYLWGVNNGILEKDEYKSTIERSWKYLTEVAMQPDGSIGYVQPIGERANQHKSVGPQTTADFGVGAFLLAASEMYKYVR